MAIKPIKRYGKFTAGALDRSGEIRMRALAGLGEQLQDIAVGYGQREKEKKAEKARLEAPTVGYREGEKALVEGEYTPSEGAGAAQRMTAAQAGYVASFDNLFAKTIEDAKNTAADSTEFLNITQGALDGFMEGYSNLPPIWLDRAKTNAQQMMKSAVNPMIKRETKAALENNKLEFSASEQNVGNLQSNLAFQGDLTGLQTSRNNQAIAHDSALSQGISSDDIETRKPKHIENLQYQYFRGSLERQIYDNDELSLDKKLDAAQGSINALREAKSVAGINPDDPETSLTLSKETQAKFADNLEKEMKAFFEGEEAKLKANTLADQVRSLKRNDEFIDSVMDSDLDIDELINNVNREQAETGQDLSDVRRYLNSKKALDAKSNPLATGEIIAQIYDLNADISMEQDGARYLNGLQNIKMDIMKKRADGELSKADETALLKQIQQLTSAKTAEATNLLASNWYKASSMVKKSVAPEDYGLAIRALHFEVEGMIEQYREENDAEPTRQQIQSFWNTGALNATNLIAQDRRQKALERLQVKQPQTLPTVSTQQEYDDLKARLGVGVRYFNSVKGIVQETQ